jgi:hypothetical protein
MPGCGALLVGRGMIFVQSRVELNVLNGKKEYNGKAHRTQNTQEKREESKANERTKRKGKIDFH